MVAAGFRGFAFDAFGVEFFVVGDFAAAAEEREDLIGVGVGELGGDASVNEEKSDLGLEAVDFGGSGKGAGGFGEFGADEFVGIREGGGLGLVGEAIGRAVGGQHAAAMAVGFGEGAAIRIDGFRRMDRFQLELRGGIYPAVFLDL